MSLYQQVSSINDTFQIQITCEVLLLNSIEYLIILKMDGYNTLLFFTTGYSLRHTNDPVSVYNVMSFWRFSVSFVTSYERIFRLRISFDVNKVIKILPRIT